MKEMRMKLLLAAGLVLSELSCVFAAPPPPVEALEQQFTAVMNASCARVVSEAPAFLPADEASFMQAYTHFNGTGSEDYVIQNATKLLSNSAVEAFLTLPDTFIPGGLDVDMVLCAVLRDATPLALAEFAVQGQNELDLVYLLLNDTILMRDMLVAGGPVSSLRDMLVAGGPVSSLYGPAIAIYAAINASSTRLSRLDPPPGTPWDDRNQTTVLRRLALGTALAHAVPIPNYQSNTTVDPVARYLHYEKHYLAGDLDPAFEVLTVFECMMMIDSDAVDEDLLWLRTTMANYRPDYIARDYSWRYIQAVHQEVAYGDPMCDQFAQGVCNGHYSQIPVAGGVCGPRAFFSRFARKSFGLPTWGMTEHGHAAMSSWSPDAGWAIQLGSSWPYGWWGSRSGDDFILEAQAREVRSTFQQVLRGGWVAKARAEAPVSNDWVPSNPSAYGKGGVWGALMLYAKKIAVASTPVPARPIGPSMVPTKVDTLIAAWPQKWPAPNITTDSNGTITVPSAAVSYVNRSAPVSIMKSFDLLGEQLVLLNGNYVDPAAISFSYELTMQEASTRYLTANFSTWHINIDLLLRVNNATDDELINVPIFYSFGNWNETQAVPVQLVAGKNVLTFMRSSEAVAPITIREFFIYLAAPDIPAPPGNFTPTPPAPRPDKFIEVPAETTCAKQGITDVPSQFCHQACEALDFKYDRGKDTGNMTGCFVLTTGKSTGVCLFNTNETASVCPQQPCTVDGSVAQQICLRQ
jgi:hypothetical protein